MRMESSFGVGWLSTFLLFTDLPISPISTAYKGFAAVRRAFLTRAELSSFVVSSGCLIPGTVPVPPCTSAFMLYVSYDVPSPPVPELTLCACVHFYAHLFTGVPQRGDHIHVNLGTLGCPNLRGVHIFMTPVSMPAVRS